MFILVERYSNILLKLFFKSWALIIVNQFLMVEISNNVIRLYYLDDKSFGRHLNKTYLIKPTYPFVYKA